MSQNQSPQLGERQIIELINTELDSQTRLSKIALELGGLFAADICLVIPGIARELDPENIGWWFAHQLTAETAPTIAKLLFHLQPLHDDRSQLTTISELPAEPEDFLAVRSILKTTTTFQNQVNGMILLGKTKPYQWTRAEQEHLENLAHLVALAIQTEKLQQQVQISDRYQNLINELTIASSQNSNLDSLFQLALEATAKALTVTEGLILTLKYKNPLFKRLGKNAIPQGKAEVISRWSTQLPYLSSKKKPSFRLSDSRLLLAALHQAPQALVIADIANCLELIQPNPSLIYEPKTTTALLFMPMMGSSSSKSKTPVILGFIVLQQHQPHSWPSEELNLVKWVSNQLSTSLIHNQTLSRIQSLVEERTSQLKWSLDVQAKLSDKMRQQIEELQQLNQLKDEFLSSMSHELNTPLATMKMAIKMLRQPECSPEKQSRYLDILEQEWNREYNLIKDLLTLQKLESEKFTVQPEELDLKEILTKLATAFESKWHSEYGLQLKVNYQQKNKTKTTTKQPFKIYTDPNSLEQILQELLQNAGKYADPDTIVTVDVSRKITTNGNNLIITVTNCGLGISPEEQKCIFDKFRRGKGVTDRAVPGTGLGLTLVKSLVEQLNGTIDVASCPAEEPPSYVTSFSLTLPQLQEK